MYVFARSEANNSLAEEVISEAINKGMLRVINRYTYSQVANGNEQPAICFVCALNLLMRPSEETAPSDLLLEVLRESIPELKEGKIEAVAAVRQPGYKSKIAICSVYKGLDAMGCCTEPERLDAIETTLGENVDFIQWANNPKEFIISCLFPLTPEMVVEIELDQDNHKATVNVNGWKSKRKALGRGNLNLKLASKITCWSIEVVDISENVEVSES